MNEKVAEHLDELFVFIKVGILEGAAFVANETPILIQEILRYHMITKSLRVLLGIILAVVSIKFGVSAVREFREYREIGDKDFDEFKGSIFIMASVVAGAVSIPVLICSLAGLIKVLFAPRLFLLEYIQQLIK